MTSDGGVGYLALLALYFVLSVDGIVYHITASLAVDYHRAHEMAILDQHLQTL